jgi:hypothetical protein
VISTSYIYKPGKRQADEAGAIVKDIKEQLKIDYRCGAIPKERQTLDPERINISWFYKTMIDKAIGDYRKDRGGFLHSLYVSLGLKRPDL